MQCPILVGEARGVNRRAGAQRPRKQSPGQHGLVDSEPSSTLHRMKRLIGVILALLVLGLTSCSLFFSAPIVVIKAFPAGGFAPLSVDFDGTDSSGATSISGYKWDFGDGESGVGGNVSHTFGAGEYRVSLTVTDSLGISGTGTTTIRVHPDLAGRWSGAFIASPGETRPLGIELDLVRVGDSVTGTVTIGLYGSVAEVPIVEGTAAYDRIYILAEGNAEGNVGIAFYSVELEGTPGDVLFGDATIRSGDAKVQEERFKWVAISRD
jgi:hypothetical protein